MFLSFPLEGQFSVLLRITKLVKGYSSICAFLYSLLMIELQSTFFQMVCPCCFSFFIPGQNCLQHFYTRPQIRKIKEQKRKNKKAKTAGSTDNPRNKEEDIKYIIYSSQLFSYEKTNYNKESLFTSFKCTKCKTLIVHDNTPLEFAEHNPKSLIKPTQQTAKPSRENLQKVLQKSQLPKASGSAKKEMDLESFLKGFI